MDSLFRREVFENRHRRHLGEAFISIPITWWLIVGFLGILLVTLVVASIVTDYTRRETVYGYLTPSDGIIQINTPKEGIYKEVFVKTGDIVENGDRLFKVEYNIAKVDGVGAQENLQNSLYEELSFIEEQRGISINKHRTETSKLNKQKSEAFRESENLAVQIKSQKRTVEIESTLFRKMESLFSDQIASTSEVTAQERRYLASEQILLSLENTRLKLLASIKEKDAEIEISKFEAEEETAVYENKVNKIKQDISKIQFEKTVTIHAPVSGKVSHLLAFEGQLASPSEGGLSILPQSSELQAYIFIPSSSIGFMEPEQVVQIKYDAFPFQKFGSFKARIMEISSTVIDTKNLFNAPKIDTPVYLAVLKLDDQSLQYSEKELALHSGMTLSANIPLEKRKVWEWLFGPILNLNQ